MYKICKTEESAARQRELELGLLDAMLRQDYDKITVCDLCRELRIPRKTFYRYFPSREDALLSLIDHKLSDCNDHVFRDWDGESRFQMGNLERFFSYWYAQEAFLSAIQANRLQYLLLDRSTQIVDRMKQTATQTPDPSFARGQVDYFIAHGLMASVLRWHHFGFPCPPEEMAGVFTQMLTGPNVSISRLFL